jgi:hypothetical protein
MNNQEVFDKIWEIVNDPEFVPGRCLYRHRGKPCCPFGHLIPDKLYDLVFEGKTIDNVLGISEDVRDLFADCNPGLLSRLQEYNDVLPASGVVSKEYTRRHFKETAEIYLLTFKHE